MPRILDEENDGIVGELLCTARSVDLQNNPHAFRDALRRLGLILGLEIARTLKTTRKRCTTPLGVRDEPVLAEIPVLVTILRASLPMWEGMLDVFRASPTMVIGAARREGTLADTRGQLDVDLSYAALAPVEGRTVIYVDPMVATGGTILKLHPDIVRRAGRPARVIVAGVIGYRATAVKLEREIPDCSVILASADDTLNERGYIVPGLGDAGDLAFGPKL